MEWMSRRQNGRSTNIYTFRNTCPITLSRSLFVIGERAFSPNRLSYMTEYIKSILCEHEHARALRHTHTHVVLVDTRKRILVKLILYETCQRVFGEYVCVCKKSLNVYVKMCPPHTLDLCAKCGTFSHLRAHSFHVWRTYSCTYIHVMDCMPIHWDCSFARLSIGWPGKVNTVVRNSTHSSTHTHIYYVLTRLLMIPAEFACAYSRTSWRGFAHMHTPHTRILVFGRLCCTALHI